MINNFFMHLILSFFLLSTSIRLHDERVTVELARTDEERSRGLMNREMLADGTGMLFIYPQAAPLFFWMKDTKIPLSVGFFDEQKRLINIEHMNPTLGPYPIYRSKKNAIYALEVPQGWFERHHITPGTFFEWE